MRGSASRCQRVLPGPPTPLTRLALSALAPLSPLRSASLRRAREETFAARVDCSTRADSRDVAAHHWTAFVILFTCQTANVSSFPRRVLRPGFCFLASHTRMRGGGAPRKRSGARAPVGRALTRHARRLARRLASLGRRSPLGAPPWRFWAPVPRFPHRQLSLACASASNRIGHSELLASGS